METRAFFPPIVNFSNEISITNRSFCECISQELWLAGCNLLKQEKVKLFRLAR